MTAETRAARVRRAVEKYETPYLEEAGTYVKQTLTIAQAEELKALDFNVVKGSHEDDLRGTDLHSVLSFHGLDCALRVQNMIRQRDQLRRFDKWGDNMTLRTSIKGGRSELERVHYGDFESSIMINFWIAPDKTVQHRALFDLRELHLYLNQEGDLRYWKQQARANKDPKTGRGDGTAFVGIDLNRCPQIIIAHSGYLNALQAREKERRSCKQGSLLWQA